MGALNPRAETLFHEALERAPEAREAFISTITKDDSCLRREILDLIAAYTEAEAFFDLPVSLCMAEKRVRPKTEEAGDQIGQYKLIEQIGQGGFGTVWVADQEVPLHRRVALKIIKLGMDTNEVIARFDQERQALAMMEHPNIARVLDAGATEHGRPFFVMELVQGTKITEYCDAQELSINQRLELLVQVCHAVQHAHQKGIIHRDLKPSNIIVPLIDELAVPKVIDFGVAKALKGKLSDLTVYTHVEQTVGTPLYMSPEQAEMTSQDIDTRSDIYSLGVLLYELLTGRTPIDQGTVARVGLDEIRRVIREVNPPRPSIRVRSLTGAESTNTARRRQVEPKKLLTLLRGDLDWIVMKCLEKDRKRRYNTASGLALDLQRHLANEVIIARPPTTGYLLSKFIRRNTLAFAASAAIAVALLVGIAASSWQAVRANRALAELRATAPAFAEQARGLAAKEQFDDAISKLDYALRLRPDAAEYLMAKGDLLQCQLKLAEAAAIYREALRVQPGLGPGRGVGEALRRIARRAALRAGQAHIRKPLQAPPRHEKTATARGGANARCTAARGGKEAPRGVLAGPAQRPASFRGGPARKLPRCPRGQPARARTRRHKDRRSHATRRAADRFTESLGLHRDRRSHATRRTAAPFAGSLGLHRDCRSHATGRAVAGFTRSLRLHTDH
jgi:serine/threonine protein kinase